MDGSLNGAGMQNMANTGVRIQSTPQVPYAGGQPVLQQVGPVLARYPPGAVPNTGGQPRSGPFYPDGVFYPTVHAHPQQIVPGQVLQRVAFSGNQNFMMHGSVTQGQNPQKQHQKRPSNAEPSPRPSKRVATGSATNEIRPVPLQQQPQCAIFVPAHVNQQGQQTARPQQMQYLVQKEGQQVEPPRRTLSAANGQPPPPTRTLSAPPLPFAHPGIQQVQQNVGMANHVQQARMEQPQPQMVRRMDPSPHPATQTGQRMPQQNMGGPPPRIGVGLPVFRLEPIEMARIAAMTTHHLQQSLLSNEAFLKSVTDAISRTVKDVVTNELTEIIKPIVKQAVSTAVDDALSSSVEKIKADFDRRLEEQQRSHHTQLHTLRHLFKPSDKA